METLFELPPPDAPEQHAGTGQTCGNCVNAVSQHYYRTDWIYCKVRACKRTQYGIEKVKSRQADCGMFEAKREKREVTK